MAVFLEAEAASADAHFGASSRTAGGLHTNRRRGLLFRAELFSLALFFFLLLAATAFGQGNGTSSRVDELKQNISSNEEEIKKIEAEIAEYKDRIESAGAQKKTLQNTIQTLDLTRTKLKKDAELTQAKISRTNATITILNRGISEKEERIKQSRDAIKNIILKMNEADSDTLLEIMLGSKSVSEFFVEVDDLNRMQISIRDYIQSLGRLKGELEESKTTTEGERRKLLALNGQLGDQKAITDNQRKSQATLLSTTKNQEANYKKMLADRETRKKQFEREIEDFEAQLRAEVDTSTFPASGTKVLAYPLENVFVTQKFGKTVDARRLYLSGTHNGTDFRASPGTPVKAAGDGIVVGTGDTDRVCAGASYGKWVMIKHKNGLSTIYGHLDLIKVSERQSVKVGDLIGYSGSTGHATGPHLHFGLFVSAVVEMVDLPSKSCKGAIFHIPAAPAKGYLDPEAYL
ncbi:MAG: peptidoglycan DD-metalloendopeptidase family protein [bacterium]|nr:peptidoglycan DD-metalloendopeptidase family protein [bacterium]